MRNILIALKMYDIKIYVITIYINIIYTCKRDYCTDNCTLITEMFLKKVGFKMSFKSSN